ncbi:MAG: superoxide dismutase family protein [Sandarakinorhabdus sp.]|nr:superoxide dismutase family protein [Sandarakinorhabdus sp.]
MRAMLILPLLFIAAGAMAAKPKPESLGKTGGAMPQTMTVTPLLSADGTPLGSVRLLQEAAGTRVYAEVKGLPVGDYAIHIHAVGSCVGPDFTSAGGHFNPEHREHGAMNPAGSHAGDLPNISVVAGAGGITEGSIDALRAGLRLRDGAAPLSDSDGAAVVIHAKADDYKTDPTGNAGARLLCGVVAPPLK